MDNETKNLESVGKGYCNGCEEEKDLFKGCQPLGGFCVDCLKSCPTCCKQNKLVYREAV